MSFVAAATALGASAATAAAIGAAAPAVIGGVAAVAGGAIAAKGAKSAAQTQANAALDANATNKAMFDEQVALQAPFRDTGLAANNRLAFLLGLTPGSTSGAPTTPTAAPTMGISPTPSFGGLSPQMLTQGSDGVFAPPAGPAPVMESMDAIRARLAPQFADPGTLEAEAQAESSRQQQAASVYQQGQSQAQQAQSQIQQAQSQAQQPTQPANNLSTFGSLAQQFGQAEFAADGAPKVPAFNQAVPTAPTQANFQDMPAFNPDMMKEDPGYQFRLDQGMKGVNNSAAARGGLLSGAALKATDQYNQDYASGEYGNAFNRYQTTRGNKLQDYLTNQNTGQQNFQNQNTAYNTNLNKYSLNRANSLQDYSSAFDRFQTNRSNVINPLLSLSGVGQQATNQTSNAAQNYGAQSAAAVTGAGNAMAAGQVGSANALGGAFSGASNAFSQNQLMNLLLSRNNGNSSGGVTPPNPLFTSGSFGASTSGGVTPPNPFFLGGSLGD